MNKLTVCSVILAVLSAPAAIAALAIQDDGKALTVAEDGKPVLVYNYTRVNPPADVDQEKFWRTSYIHPLYGLDGDVLTQDFPDDHRHHRGVFWAWPDCKVGDRKMDIWAIGGVRQLFEKWLAREETPGYARIGVENLWKFDNEDAPKVREQVYITVRPADDKGRNIDFSLQFQNVSEESVTILGSVAPDLLIKTEKAKGYGGFSFRPDKARSPMLFTCAKGELSKDVLSCDTPWIDVSLPIRPDGPYSGVAMFQHPANPGYPHPGWMVRHYGFLGASWPHSAPCILEPGQAVTLQYRLYVHRGQAADADIAGRFASYVAESR